MDIDDNDLEKRALKAFYAGDRELGHELQDEFVEAVRTQFADKDHCSCQKPCKYHGKCLECVAIHRAHRDHLPNCFHSMINDRLKSMSGLTEHSVIDSIVSK